MKGLLIKDLYVLLKQMRIFLLMVVVFAIIPGSSMTTFAVIYAAMMPYTALAYDERSRWGELAGMMPYSTREIVLSKYVLGWLFTGGAAVIALAAGLVEARMGLRGCSPRMAILSLCIGVIMMAITLPPMFRFGVEKGRMLFILVMVVAALSSVSLVNALDQVVETRALMSVLGLCLPVAAVVLSAVSVLLSVRFYTVQNH
ncbi:MAG: ABC-2 transporter permease [Oscillibacter sp.]|jgi:hypothetical protein|nr:ABC-2 transporter permease [Oscillibacter sp.]